MKLSVIIVSYNVCDFLRQTILSVQCAIKNIEAEVIIVDNNSPDDSCVMLRKEFPKLSLIQNKENIGFGRANNQAVAQAKGEFVCILNPDTAVASDVFIKCLAFIKENPDCGAIGVRLIDGTGSFLPESKRNLPTPSVSLSKIAGCKKQCNSYYANYLAEDETGPVTVLPGAFMFMRRNLYNEVGGFDKAFFMYGEDIDLSYKIEKSGYKNYYLGSAYVLHYKGESTQQDKEYLDRFYGAMHIFYKKHFSKNFLQDSLIYLGIEITKLLKGFSLGQKRSALPTIKAIYLLSEDQEFYERLKFLYSQSIQQIKLNELSHQNLEDTKVIWDANEYDYDVILENMSRFSSCGIRYRIRPSDTWQLIGSDRSDEKGCVVNV